MQVHSKVGKSRKTFHCFVGPGGSKSRLPKTAGAEPVGQMKVKNCTHLWREAYLQVKMYKTPKLGSTFGSRDVEILHAVVARSTCPSQKCKKLWF